ncbi:MAG: tetratricopeptide repeat protein [Planctomycetia bacterium]|nr:tetratricopeptide repeat protein [Planctomycetia bacterium]
MRYTDFLRRRSFAMRTLGILAVALAAVCTSAAAPPRAASDDAIEAPPARASADQPPDPRDPSFIPAASAGEERDRKQALILFGTARKKQDQGDETGAIRLFQRAHRLDPKSAVIVEHVVPLLFKQRRMEEGVRYALRMVKLRPDNTNLMQQLALHLTERGDPAGALELYEKILEIEPAEEQKTPQHVVRVMERGRLSFLTGKHEQAANCFADVLKAIEHADDFGLNAQARGLLLGDASQTYTLFGEAFLKAGRLDEAQQAFESAQSVDRDKAALAYRMAQVELARKEPAKAMEKLQAYFESKSQSQGALPYEFLGEILKAQEKADDLLPKLEELFKNDEKNPYLAFCIGEQQRAKKAWDAAAAAYKSALDNAKADSAEMRILQFRIAGGLVESYRHTKEAGPMLDVLGLVVERAGDLDPVAQQVRPVAADKELAAAIISTAREGAKADNPDFSKSLAAALVALEAGLDAETKEMFEMAITARPESSGEVIMMWGLGLLIADKHAQAAEVFRRGRDEDALGKTNPAFHFYLAGALAMDDKTDEALEAARQAAGMNDKNARLAARPAWVLYRAHRYDEAAKEYQAILEKFDDNQTPDARSALREAKLVCSNIDVIRRKFPEAEEWVEQVLDEFPDDPTANNDLAYLWSDQGKGKNLRRALAMSQKAVATDPDNAAFLDTIGWVHYKLGNFEEAAKHLEKAAQEESPDAVILDHLGDVRLALGQVDKARDAWQKALEKLDKERDTDRIEATKGKLDEHKAP